MKDKIFGIYRAAEKDEKVGFMNDFTLLIYEEEDQIKFDFEMTTEGPFGAIGKNWYGKGFFRADHLALKIEKEKDWIFTKDDNGMSENIKDKNETLPIEIYTDNNSAIIYHKYIDKYILLRKKPSSLDGDDDNPYA